MITALANRTKAVNLNVIKMATGNSDPAAIFSPNLISSQPPPALSSSVSILSTQLPGTAHTPPTRSV